MYAIIGLGNPGRRYERTRHNVGFRVIDELSSRLNIGLTAGGEEYDGGAGTYEGAGFFLIKPLSYMNSSGIAVAQAVEEQSVSLAELLVVCDDANLPPGTLRIRRSGSDGGHKGLASIIDSLGTEAFARLRIGIGNPPPGVALIDFVLGEFCPEEEKVIQEAVLHATEAVLAILGNGLEWAMNAFN